MADKKDTKEKANVDVFETLVFWFIVILLISGFLTRLGGFFSSSGDVGLSVRTSLGSFFSSIILPFLKLFSYGVSVLSFFGILWFVTALSKINAEQNMIYNPPHSEGATGENQDEKKNRRWEKVLEHINSENPSDWKFAVLEADIILDELLTAMGYRGETLSDKLKGVEKSDFTSIEEAWEAHKVRNQIAHEGADFILSEREARRVISLFETVFKEFNFI